MPVAEALDRVLEILRTTELYSPQLGTKDEDPHTSDLVGGLMTVSRNPRERKSWRENLQGLFIHPAAKGRDLASMKPLPGDQPGSRAKETLACESELDFRLPTFDSVKMS